MYVMKNQSSSLTQTWHTLNVHRRTSGYCKSERDLEFSYYCEFGSLIVYEMCEK